MKTTHLPPIVISVGLVLIALSLIWPRTVGTAVWTDEEARQYSQASGDMHRLMHEHEHGPNPAAGRHEGSDGQHESNALKATKQRHQQLEAQFQRAQSLRLTVAAALKWSGVVCLVAGVVIAYCLGPRSTAG